MTRVRFRTFSRGWFPMGDITAMPPNTLRRARGMHAVKTGVLRSRWGATELFPLAAHSLYRFAGARFQGSGVALYKDGVFLLSGLNGSRLTFVRMPPSPGDVDYLFVAGGGRLLKIAPNGATSAWGIAAPQIDPILTLGAAGVLNGTYKYAVTFLNSTTGSRSNPDPAVFSATGPVSISPVNQQVVVSNIAISTDPQIDRREIWRTAANLDVLFLLAVIPDNTTTTFTDNLPDSTFDANGPLQLPIDNAPLSSTTVDALGPYQGRMWTLDHSPGNAGRAFFSPIGRPEAVAGFVEINNGDDPTQRLVNWGGVLYCWTNGKIIQIIGQDEPFTFSEVFGAPGTTQPFSVVATPFGIVYQAVDGVRIFDGTLSRLIGWDALALLFQGESLEDVPPFTAIISEYSGREVWLSDTVTTLVLDPNDGTWRVARDGVTALYYEPDTQLLTASYDTVVVVMEPPNVTLDVADPIDFEVETPGRLSDVSDPMFIERVYFEVDTAGQELTPTLVLENTTMALPPFITTGRPAVPPEYAIGVWDRVVAVRLDGLLTKQVTVYGIDLDIYVPVTTAMAPA